MPSDHLPSSRVSETEFLCLNPRKAKKRNIKSLLSPIGPIEFRTMPPMGFTLYSEADNQASAAFSNAISPGRLAFLNGLKLWVLRRFYCGARAYFEANPNTVAVAWNGLNSMRQVFMRAAQDAGNKTLFFELAPFPDRITADPKGVNFENSLPRTAAPYLAWAKVKCRDPHGWRALRDTITQRKPSAKYQTSAQAPAMEGPFIFVPLQVPGDSQMRVFGGQYRTIEQFVDTILSAAHNCPPGWHIRIKEHPSAAPFVRKAIEASGVTNVRVDNVTDTFAQVKAAELVLTINSSVGLEAMFFDKPVVAAGQCFWAIDGIAAAAQNPQALADLFSTPLSASFDPLARQAFFNFLNEEYYPRLSTPKSIPMTDRLNGPDAFGFWSTTPIES